ncbi:MAG: sporulation protein [Lewinella sp.]|nr:sporulation protein [Lewinella sp.]
MQNPIDDLLPRITSFLRDEAKTETVIGEVFTLGEFSCVPVVRVGFGFGGALGEGDGEKKAHGEGGGAGAGMGIEPIGFLVAHKDEITFLPTREKSGLSTAFEQLPELMDKFVEMRKEERMAETV